jgi:hypothetical protein
MAWRKSVEAAGEAAISEVQNQNGRFVHGLQSTQPFRQRSVGYADACMRAVAENEYSPALRAAAAKGLCAVCGGQFCTNLYTLLMKRPLGGMAVLGVDPVLVRP